MSEAPREPHVDPALHLAAFEQLHGLTIAPDWRAGIETNIATIARAAQLVLSFPLPDELESAAVFRLDPVCGEPR